MLRRLLTAAVLVALVASTPAGAMYAERHTVSLTTAGDGSVIGYTPHVSGSILAIVYTKDGTTPFAAGVDFAITLEATGQNIWTEANIDASETVYPIAAAQLPAGTAASTLTEVPIVAANDRVKISITNGGSAKLGSVIVVVGG
jgi:hypothetical protein